MLLALRCFKRKCLNALGITMQNTPYFCSLIDFIVVNWGYFASQGNNSGQRS